MAADAAELVASTRGRFIIGPVMLVETAARATVTNQDRLRWLACRLRCKRGRSCSVVVANVIFSETVTSPNYKIVEELQME